ncbi:MAG: hypothetical protein IPG50_33080 [Myxococcales bacterium]|nr:hypothetical protein [Myxococcales bacterium]
MGGEFQYMWALGGGTASVAFTAASLVRASSGAASAAFTVSGAAQCGNNS